MLRKSICKSNKGMTLAISSSSPYCIDTLPIPFTTLDSPLVANVKGMINITIIDQAGERQRLHKMSGICVEKIQRVPDDYAQAL